MATTLDMMSALARALKDADENVELLDTTLKAAKERARFLREETIPSAMQELGLEFIGLDTGEKLAIKQDVYASIPSDKKNEAYDWLDEHGFGGLLKVEVSVSFGSGERDASVELLQELQGRGLQVGFDQSVHAQTLKAFLREQIKSAAEIPLELFGARPVWTTKITKK